LANGIINSLKRLERAGNENSRATQKLFKAANDVAAFIEEAVPFECELPRGYRIEKVRSNVGSASFLVKEGEFGCDYIDGIGGYLHGDFHCWIPEQKRSAILQFAEDIATGLLDEIAEFLEKRADKSLSAAEVLTDAIKKGDAALGYKE